MSKEILKADTVDQPSSSQKPLAIKVGRLSFTVPTVIADARGRASKRFLEFFTAPVRNRNTRLAYARALGAFLACCEEHGLAFDDIEAVTVAAYVEQLLADGMAKPSVKQHLAAIRMLFDWMVTGGLMPFNPAAAVRGPKYVIKKGKTPVLKPDEVQLLLDSIPLVKTVIRGQFCVNGDWMGFYLMWRISSFSK
ncbi:MAG: site-specific integrase [Acidobacteriota bacterium]|nr:site-specific integrase [Acidobacteriota bacterium]